MYVREGERWLAEGRKNRRGATCGSSTEKKKKKRRRREEEEEEKEVEKVFWRCFILINKLFNVFRIRKKSDFNKFFI